MYQVTSTVESAVEQTSESDVDPGVLDQIEQQERLEQLEAVEEASIPYYREIVTGGVLLSVLCLILTLAVISIPVSVQM